MIDESRVASTEEAFILLRRKIDGILDGPPSNFPTTYEYAIRGPIRLSRWARFKRWFTTL